MANNLKKLYILIFLVMFGFGYSRAATPYVYMEPDSLQSYLKIKDANLQQKKLINYIKLRFQNGPENALGQGKAIANDALNRYNVANNTAYKLFIESVVQSRLKNLTGAENALLKAIDLAAKAKADFLLYSFLSHLAFVQTDKGNAIGAIYSYGLAQKQAIKLNDPQLQVLLNINISDLYYKINLYNQSLFYLNNALAVKEQYHVKDDRQYTLIRYNKAENFYRMNRPDSLKRCYELLMGPNNKSYKLHTYQKRTHYYLSLLNHDYKGAIKQIHALQVDTQYVKNDTEEQSLADAYYMNGQTDSAKIIIDSLLQKPSFGNHPELKYHLYEMLGDIAQKSGDNKLAADNYKLALKQSEQRLNNTTQVGNISAQIKIDKIESSFVDTAEKFKRERMMLILIVIAAVFMIAVIALLYRSIRQKRHYEKLLFDTKKQELAFINSHEIRKHLTNILGIIDIIRHSDNKQQEFLEAEDYLFKSATRMDDAIKNISDKLSD